MVLLCIALVSFLLSSSAYADRQRSYNLLSVVNKCRTTRGMSYDMEETVHLQMTSIRHPRLTRLGPGFRHAVSVVEQVYVKFLRSLREEQIGRENLGLLVKQLTKENAKEYMGRCAMADITPFLLSLGIHDETVGGDVVRQEYYKSLKAAMEAFESTNIDYIYYKRIPAMQKDVSLLGLLENFISTSLGKYDHSATFPDAVICLSLLQYRKYLALLDSEIELVKIVGEHYKAAVAALKSMQIRPVLQHDYILNGTKTIVHLMPQEQRGPMMIPVTPKKFRGQTHLKIGVKDLNNPFHHDAVYSQLIQLGIFDLIVDPLIVTKLRNGNRN